MQTPSRRQVLRTAPIAALSLTGCLDRITGTQRLGTLTPSPTPTGEEPEDTTPLTQFQYDEANRSVVGSTAPESIHERWRTTIEPVDGGLSMADGRLLVAARGHLFALDAESGEELWNVRVGHAEGPAPALSPDTAYVTTWNGGPGQPRGLVAIDLDGGSTRWRAISDVDVTSAPTLADGAVYVGGSMNSENVIALDATTGDERWRFPAGEYATTPAIADGTVYAGGGKEHVAYALDAMEGEELWRFEADDRVWAAPTVVDETVYVGTRGGTLYALDTSDGEELWRARVGSDVRASVAATDEAVYVPERNSLRALSVDGDELWSVDVRDGAFAPTGTRDAVVITDRWEAFCLDVADGSERWRFEPRERTMTDVVYSGFQCEPVVADGVVYVASQGGDVYALEAAR